jgi:hypothetical protein
MFICKRNEYGDHYMKRERMCKSFVSKGTEKRIVFFGTGIVGKYFSNQGDKNSRRNME